MIFFFFKSCTIVEILTDKKLRTSSLEIRRGKTEHYLV